MENTNEQYNPAQAQREATAQQAHDMLRRAASASSAAAAHAANPSRASAPAAPPAPAAPAVSGVRMVQNTVAFDNFDDEDWGVRVAPRMSTPSASIPAIDVPAASAVAPEVEAVLAPEEISAPAMPAPVEQELPAPAMPTPVEPTPAMPAPVEPAMPAPAMPVPAAPAPSVPAVPALPEPVVPAPPAPPAPVMSALVEQELPAPVMAAPVEPELAAPAVPAPAAPTRIPEPASQPEDTYNEDPLKAIFASTPAPSRDHLPPAPAVTAVMPAIRQDEPSVEDLAETAAAAKASEATPATGMWRAVARKMGFPVKESRDEILWHTMVRYVNHPLPGPIVIGVTAFKGGVAKTTNASAVSVAISRLREGARVCAVDTDPHGGLALRAEGEQVSNIKEFAAAIRRGNEQRPNFMSRTADGVDILGSTQSVVEDPITADDWELVLTELRHRYDIIVVDMSIAQHTDVYGAILRSLDALVITATPTVESTRPLDQVPVWLDRNGAGHLKSRRMVVFTKVDTHPDQVDIGDLMSGLRRAGVEAASVPFDQHLREAANVAFDDMAAATRKQCVLVAATAIKIAS